MSTGKTAPKLLPDISREEADRFWSFVEIKGPDECWPWLGKFLKSTGYGYFRPAPEDGSAPKMVHSHRLAFKLHYGGDPWPLSILHGCDFPPCHNPEHYALGTQADNVADRDRKGRTAKGDRTRLRKYPEQRMHGEDNGNSRLTGIMVAFVRQVGTHGKRSNVGALSGLLGVSKVTIHNILHNKAWAHVKYSSDQADPAMYEATPKDCRHTLPD